ncbi:unnamed protein product [Tuber melanosporum]|jgi:hypothetical protein|uniref:receptor protein-tyrosine kinase n=1 Tax=Tuber melanosporum (strain Mel28) TaxID=656061 RepID=D5G9Z0_TUBMM|nr:uncharacterized protein GSTUM_00003463001 [Tuber melanosporum]CAZ81333.1 unnamed protein product [Tuber melanosporum]
MSKLNISPQSLAYLLFILPTFTSALITRQPDDVDEDKQGQVVVSTDGSAPPPPPPPPPMGPKTIVPGLDDGSTIACIVGGISLIVVIPMFVYIWRRRRRLRRARAPPRSLDKVALVDRRGGSIDEQESQLPSPLEKLERTGTSVSFASEVTVMDQVAKPQPVFHAM